MLDDLLAGLFGGLLGARLSGRIERRRAARLRQRGELDCALRDLSGNQPHLSSGWRRGIALMEEGLLVMDQVDLPITSIDLASERAPEGKEAWSAHPFTRIVVAANEGGTVEIALQKCDVPWFLDQLGRPFDEQDPPVS